MEVEEENSSDMNTGAGALTPHDIVKKRRREILRRKEEKEEEKRLALQEQNKRMVELDDVLTLVLQKWSFPELLHYMQHYVVRVLQHRADPLAFEESRFADETLLETGVPEEEEISLCAYCREVCRCAARDCSTGSDNNAARQHYTTVLRGCFLVLLVYDSRVRQFVMARHHINYVQLHCRPPGRLKANAYVEAVQPHVDAFIHWRQIPMSYMVELCLQLWHSEQFTMRCFSEQPFLYQSIPPPPSSQLHHHQRRHASNMLEEEEEENIPHNGHPQRLLTESRTNCDLSLIDELGY